MNPEQLTEERVLRIVRALRAYPRDALQGAGQEAMRAALDTARRDELPTETASAMMLSATVLGIIAEELPP